jgi:purine-binding chemotaxis protein CheW
MDGMDKALREEPRPRNVMPPRVEPEIIQLIIFNLGDEEFCVDITQVREIIRRSTITPIPDSPDFIQGVTNVRGEIAVVIDLKSRFYLPSSKTVEEKHIIMTEQDKNLFGLMVDEVTEVLRIPRTEIKPTPELVTRIDRVYISGVITMEKRLIMMLDLTKVLSEEELKKLSEIRVRHRQTIERPRDKAEKEEGEEVRTEEMPLKTEMIKAPKQARRKKQGGLNA